MNTNVTADVEISLGNLTEFKEAIKKKKDKFYTLAQNPELKRDIMELYALHSMPYIPYDTGNLSEGYSITKDGVLSYRAKSPYNGYHYAGRVYEGMYRPKLKTARGGRKYFKREHKMQYNRAIHPKATDHWNIAFEAGPEYKKFIRSVRRIVVIRFTKDPEVRVVGKAEFLDYMIRRS